MVASYRVPVRAISSELTTDLVISLTNNALILVCHPHHSINPGQGISWWWCRWWCRRWWWWWRWWRWWCWRWWWWWCTSGNKKGDSPWQETITSPATRDNSKSECFIFAWFYICFGWNTFYLLIFFLIYNYFSGYKRQLQIRMFLYLFFSYKRQLQTRMFFTFVYFSILYLLIFVLNIQLLLRLQETTPNPNVFIFVYFSLLHHLICVLIW